ncbi:zinc finger protein on ecdysone puffs isoform X2 [Condylostylus longicornis]|nr:zinc finger protein on ecdysone puffs isoform X2 [Condylostylus longicornis]
MAFRSGGNNRRSGGNFGGGFGGRNMNPWDQGGFGGGMRQGGGPMNADALSLANNLLNNLLRNQNPPSLLDLPRGGGSMSGNRNRGQMGNRAGGNRSGNRRQGSGFGGGGGGGNRGNQKSGGNNKGGIRKQNAFDRAKKLLAKNSNKKKDSADKSENKSLSKESIYADVPNDMFYCHLCKKHMWDSNSFENHIKGRTHLMMREGIEESYRLKANMIRQEAKIAEQLKAIELDRLKRIGKSGKAMARDYCTMCDLNFHGHMTSHRKTEGHLALKKFLHPKCIECNKEFSTRIEFDTHLLTPDHLKKAAEKNTKVGERKKANLIILTEEEESKDVRPPAKKKKKSETKKAEGEKTDEEKKENGEENAEGGEGDEEKKEHVEGEENKDADMNETKEEEEEEEVTLAEDPADCILDYHDGDEVPVEIEARLPKYNWLRPVGTSLIHKLECFECQLCAKFFDTEKTAEIHTRTVSHHRQFTKFLNEKSSDTKIAQKRAAAAIEESERKKRRIEEAAAAAQKEDENGEKEEDENAEGGDGDLYDPSEATGDEDVDMNNDANGDASEGKNEQNGQIEEDKQEEMETEEPEVKEPEPEPEPEQQEPEPEIAEPEKTKSPAKGAAAKTPAAKTPAKSTPRGKQRGRGRYNY